MNIRGEQIKNLITKFYYKNNSLYFQIFLLFDREETMPYSEHNDYAEYKKMYSQLLDVKSKNLSLNIPEKVEKINLNYA